jgi:hypothetical protein
MAMDGIIEYEDIPVEKHTKWVCDVLRCSPPHSTLETEMGERHEDGQTH